MPARRHLLGLSIGNFGAPPLGPWRLAFFLRTNGQHVDVWDCNVSEKLNLPSPDEHVGRDRAATLAEAFVAGMEADFDLSSYAWIGFSILNDTLVTTLSIIELLRKKYPKVILLGGNHESTVNLGDCLGKSQLNAVILADAEEPMLALMQGIEPSKVPGVVWRNFNPKPSREAFEKWNAGIKWNEIPYRAYWDRTASLYPLDQMDHEERLSKLQEIKTIRCHTIVSCELSCTYCSVANTRRIASGSNKPSIINLSSNALEHNLLAIKEQVPDVMTIYDSSDEAWLGRGRAEEYLSTLEKIKPIMDAGLERGMRYLIQCRSQDLDDTIIERAAKVGVKHLTIGIESPIEAVRKAIKKPQREDMIRDIMRSGTKHGVSIYGLFIFFLPDLCFEQMREAITNLRTYIELGATVSIEPFCMLYLATAMADDPTLLTEYAGYDIPFSGTPPKRLKWATLIWPHDRRVCAMLQWTRNNLDEFIANGLKKLGNKHGFKGQTGSMIVDCIEHGLDLYDKGEIPPWELTGSGQRSAVYQDFGDQMSGSEIAAAASTMMRPNKTASRYNSTHSLLDDTNAGVKGRIKDPAFPHEMHLPIIKDKDEK